MLKELEEKKNLYPNQRNEEKSTAANAIVSIAAQYVEDEKYFPICKLFFSVIMFILTSIINF